MQFSYEAIDEKGVRKRGVVDALSLRDAVAEVRRLGMITLNVKPVEKRAPFIGRMRRKMTRVSVLERALLARHLALMLRAGVTLDRSLMILADQMEKKLLREIVKDVLEAVRRGETLADALRRHPNVFPKRFCAMVAWGEQAGALPKSLSHLASQLEHDYKIISSVRGAMLYPAVIVLAIVVVAIIMATFVLPQLVSIVESFDAELPMLTRIFIASTNFLVGNILLILLAFATLIMSALFLLRRDSVRSFVSATLLHVPVVGPFIRQVNLARMNRALASLVESGVPIVDSINIVRDGMSNRRYRLAVDHIANDVRSGQDMASSMRKFPDLFPPMQIHMVEVGNESGNLVTVLSYMAEFYEERVNTLTESLTKLIEPILLVAVGIVVGIIVLAVIMPIYQLSEDII